MIPDYFIKYEFKPKINTSPNNDLSIIVVIPSYNEPNLRESLESLLHCKRPNCSIEVITVINYPSEASSDVIENANHCIEVINRINSQSNNSGLQFFSIFAPNLPKKQAGVGFARKVGMDEAAYRLFTINNPKGIIACYDADSDCMDNYLVELEKLWSDFPKTNACSIRYEHPVNGEEFEPSIYKGITQYELHLRYYNQASRFIKFPFAYHTIGSSMACCAESYVKFGGMNRHKAGEDFYFLQKIIPHGNFAELNSTCVFPSPRPSNRVPFGTGRAMLKHQQSPEESILTYDFKSFLTLIPLFESIEFIYKSDSLAIINWSKSLHPALQENLIIYDFAQKISEIKANTNSVESFRKRFFFWFDAFMLLKYLNFAHENYFQRKPVDGESIALAKEIGLKLPQNPSSIDLLKSYREKDCR
ncbi:MAG: glycosyltransferase family 2 protein [Bacteroidales bacterium]|nr:MAG: glycosyltransferase family 2 protein [Bacteroidales bacterium]